MMRVTYREFYPVRVDCSKPSEHGAGGVAKIALRSEADRYEKEQGVYGKGNQAQPTRTRWEGEDHGGQL